VAADATLRIAFPALAGDAGQAEHMIRSLLL
jgi:hypothetical protein